MNRQQRRAAAAMRRGLVGDGDRIVALDRADLVRITAELVAADPTVSGATIITATGEITYLDAAALRQGGRA